MKTTLLALTMLTALAALAANPPSLLNRLKDENARGQKQWIYNDYQKAVAVAKATGKPIFVTFRCVPCEACESFDAEVAKNNQRIKNLAEKQFISLRLVEMKGVDLSQFQFDYDLSWRRCSSMLMEQCMAATAHSRQLELMHITQLNHSKKQCIGF